MFHRIGAAAYKADLKNIIAFAELLGHPEKKFKTVHIAGTNGKGSTSHMIASVLQEAGYKTGLFTSPHLKDFRERIRINGQMISEKAVTEFVEEYRNDFDSISPSFFEWTTALAFKFFADEKVDVAVIETGLGGRLDSTNIITPVLSVITNISMDHMNLLGDTVEKIAAEKAGIIKKGIPVVIGERQSNCEKIFNGKAAELNAPIVFASDNFKTEFISDFDKGQVFIIIKDGELLFRNLSVGQKGVYQSSNVCTALQSVDILKEKFSRISAENILAGFQNVVHNTGLMGRWQVIGNNPLIIADVGHNEAGMRYVVEQLGKEFMGPGSQVPGPRSEVRSPKVEEDKQLHMVFGMVNDKDPSAVLSLLPRQATYYFCKADMPRAMDAKELKTHAAKFNLQGENYNSVSDAFQEAKRKAERDDVIFIGGSTFVVAEVL
jgi:dihydrofolate synthase/folylpolyglutamate synthase